MPAESTFRARRTDSGAFLDPIGADFRLTELRPFLFDLTELVDNGETISMASVATTAVPVADAVTFDDDPTIDGRTVSQIIDGSKLASGTNYLLLLTITTDSSTWTLSLVITVPEVAGSAIASTSDLDALLDLGGNIDTDRAQLLIDLATDLCQSVVAALPAAAKAVILSIAGRAYLNPSGIAQQSIGPESVSYGSALGGVYMTGRDVTTLQRLSGQGGGFSIDTTPPEAMRKVVGTIDVEDAEQIILDYPMV